MRDEDGRTLLDNSMIVYGSGNADANRHTHDNLPVLLAGSGLFAQQVPKPAPDKAPRAAKLDLTPENFPKLHALILPQETEWRHLRIHWITDLVAARKKAAAEDKPLFFPDTSRTVDNNIQGFC